MSLPTPWVSRTSKGLSVRILFSRYWPMNLASASSLLNAKVVWVRSLVPNEKKSAYLASSSCQSCSRGFYHCPDLVIDLFFHFLEHSLGRCLNVPSEIDHLVGTADQREHYQDPNGLSSLSTCLNSCSDDCLSLRLIDLRIRYGKTAASVTEHRV